MDFYVLKYVPVRCRTPHPGEVTARDNARDLKIPTTDSINAAAPEMARLVESPCWLVPVPSSTGNMLPNLALSRAIALIVPGARVKMAVRRSCPVESSSERRRRGLFGLTIDQHHIVRAVGPMELLPVYFVDNVITTGTTVAACRKALGWGVGLAFADAGTFLTMPLSSREMTTWKSSGLVAYLFVRYAFFGSARNEELRLQRSIVDSSQISSSDSPHWGQAWMALK
jgi:hypothetical protein